MIIHLLQVLHSPYFWLSISVVISEPKSLELDVLVLLDSDVLGNSRLAEERGMSVDRELVLFERAASFSRSVNKGWYRGR